MSASYTDQEVIALIGRVLNHYHLSGEHFLFNRTATGLEVLTTPNDESWLLVSLLGWLQADFDLTFLDGAGHPVDFCDYRALMFTIRSVDEDAINSLLPKDDQWKN